MEPKDEIPYGGDTTYPMRLIMDRYMNTPPHNETIKTEGKIELPEFEAILGSKEQFFYRNKMEFGFSNARWMTEAEIQSGKEFDNKNALGFHIPRMWDKILDIDKCHLQADPSNAIRNEVRSFANENNLTFFNPREHSGLLRFNYKTNNRAFQNSFTLIISISKDFSVVSKFVVNESGLFAFSKK